MHKMSPGDPSTIFVAASFTQKMPERLDSIIPPFWCQKAYDNIILAEVVRIHKKLWICSNLVRIPGDPQLEKKAQNFLWIRSTSGKLMMSYVF